MNGGDPKRPALMWTSGLPTGRDRSGQPSIRHFQVAPRLPLGARRHYTGRSVPTGTELVVRTLGPRSRYGHRSDALLHAGGMRASHKQNTHRTPTCPLAFAHLLYFM